MHKLKIFTLFYFMTTFAANASAIGTEGHGGLAVVCRDPLSRSVDKKRLELLDLNEGRTIYGLTMTNSDAAVNDQLKAIVSRLSFDDLLSKVFVAELARIRRGMEFTSPDVGLEPLPDVSLIPAGRLDRDCKYEQLAIYLPNGNLRISRDLYAGLDNRNLAALFTHEIIYKLNRQSTGTDRSVESREMTALLFADLFDESEFKRLAYEKLITVPNRTGRSRTKVHLRSSSPVSVKVMSFLFSQYIYLKAESPLGATANLSSSPSTMYIPFAGGDLPYTILHFTGARKNISFLQDGTPLLGDHGQTVFDLVNNAGSASSEGGTDFVFVP